jgi:hypothetical protein
LSPGLPAIQTASLALRLSGKSKYLATLPLVKPWLAAPQFEEYVSGKPIPVQNVNGEPIFDTRVTATPVLYLTRYEPHPFGPSANILYANSLNELEFWGCPPKTCLMKPITSEEETNEEDPEDPESLIIVSKVTYEIHIRVNEYWGDDPWLMHYLNQGYMVRPAAGEPPELNKYEGNPVLVNLDLDGTALNPGDPPTFVTFNKYKVKDWTPLALDMPTNDPNA